MYRTKTEMTAPRRNRGSLALLLTYDKIHRGDIVALNRGRGGGSTSSMLYEVASLAYSPDPVVAVASFLNLKKVEGSSGPQFLKF